MPTPPSILIFGRDSRLLETRRWVLERAGFVVSTVFDLESAMAGIDGKPVDLLILCYTISAAQCTSILDTVHALNPGMKTLILNSGRTGCNSESDFVLHDFASPEILISRVRDLTMEPSKTTD